MHDGNGLSDSSNPNGVYSNAVFENVDYDLLTIGNHELYVTDIAYETFGQFAKVYGDKYLTSNVQILNNATGMFEDIGKKYRYFTTAHGLRIMAFGVLYDFTGNTNYTKITKTADMVKQQWFLDAVNYPEPIDLFVVLGHNPVRASVSSSTFGTLYKTIRSMRPEVPLQAFGGHTHIRDFYVYDTMTTGLESGRYCETLGWFSMSGINSTQYNGTMTPKNVPHPTQKAVKVNSTASAAATYPTAGTNSSSNSSGLVYFRRYLDWNRLTFATHAVGSQDSTFNTTAGLKVSNEITTDREILNTTALLGCAPQTYCISCAPPTSNGSIFNLYPKVLAATVFNASRADLPHVVYSNTGEIRFDLVQGPFTNDDAYIVSPFADTWDYIPQVPYSQVKGLLAALNSGPYQKKKRSFEDHELQTRDFGFSALTGEDCPDGPIHSREALESRSITRNRQFQTRAIDPGYVTKDDFGTDGDDTVHTKIPSYDYPDDIMANVSFPTDGSEPELVDVVFVSFIGPDYIVPDLNALGGNYTADDIEPYMPTTYLSSQNFPDYARKYWQAGVPNCPVGAGVG